MMRRYIGEKNATTLHLTELEASTSFSDLVCDAKA